MSTLYEIHAELGQLFEAIENAETDEQRDKLVAQLQDSQIAWDDKLENCCKYIKNLDSELEAYNVEIDRLTDQRNKLQNRYDTFYCYLSKFAPKTKWSRGVHQLSWRESTKVEVKDGDALPIQYKKELWEFVPDKRQIKIDLECGADIPGVELVKVKHLQVK